MENFDTTYWSFDKFLDFSKCENLAISEVKMNEKQWSSMEIWSP